MSSESMAVNGVRKCVWQLFEEQKRKEQTILESSADKLRQNNANPLLKIPKQNENSQKSVENGLDCR